MIREVKKVIYMAKRKLYWKNSLRYQMMLRHLEEYWLTEPDELFVSVEMTFVKADGQWQAKYVDWFNPNYERIRKPGESVLPDSIPLDMMMDPPEIKIPYLDDIEKGRIRKKKKTD